MGGGGRGVQEEVMIDPKDCGGKKWQSIISGFEKKVEV